MRATVVGAGVMGMTSALALRRAGFEVRVVAERTGAAITSAAAGAVWFPFHASPPDRVNRWAARTRSWLTDLARRSPDAGVDLLRFFQYVATDARPWYADAVDDLRLTREDLPGRPGAPGRASMAWTFDAPRVEPALFMPWIEKELGAPLERRRVDSLADVDGDVVVNCTGLGARALTGDAELRAVYGYIVVTEPGDIPMRASVSDDRSPGALFYTIPRRGEVVLGGCAEPCADDRDLGLNPAMRDAVLRRCRDAGLAPGPVVREYGGLRPFRTAVRLERDSADPRVIHNYGHGGAGYTLCWGCAEEVVALARAVIAQAAPARARA